MILILFSIKNIHWFFFEIVD